jgi:CNT family concentrative nucleoside transporter
MISLIGIVLIVTVCWFLSKDRKGISWWTILSGLIIQAFLAFFILKTPLGAQIFKSLGKGVLTLIDLANKGGSFVFGSLYESNGFVFAFRVSSAIIFISSFVSVLYFIGFMHPFMKVISLFIHKTMRVSGSEALANIASAFVGQVESALPLRPYFSKLSQAQFFSIMVGGMSTMSASLVATYASLGLPTEYLLAANIMGIPSGLVIAKLLWPSPKEVNDENLPEPEKTSAANVMDAAVHGAQEGLKISLGVISMLIAFVSIVSLVDLMLKPAGLSLMKVFGTLMMPIAVLMGTPWADASTVGGLLGEKIALNEFVAYLDLTEKLKLCAIDPKTLLISTFCICGFANFGSIAIQLGAFSEMMPSRRAEFAAMGIPAILAGALASCLSACWASLFF